MQGLKWTQKLCFIKSSCSLLWGVLEENFMMQQNNYCDQRHDGRNVPDISQQGSSGEDVHEFPYRKQPGAHKAVKAYSMAKMLFRHQHKPGRGLFPGIEEWLPEVTGQPVIQRTWVSVLAFPGWSLNLVPLSENGGRDWLKFSSPFWLGDYCWNGCGAITGSVLRNNPQ